MADLGATSNAVPSSPSFTPAIKLHLDRFIAYAVAHPRLVEVDTALMRAIQEPAGISCVLVYGPGGVGKTTLIKRIARRLNEIEQVPSFSRMTSLSSPEGLYPSSHLLLAKAMPSLFNWADYYRAAFDSLQEGELTGHGHFGERVKQQLGKPERRPASFTRENTLRRTLEALRQRRVRVVVIDDAQYLMRLGKRSTLLDLVDWIRSLSETTGIIHILLGTYDLLPFRDLSGRTAAHSLELHFAHYQLHYESERQAFQAALFALLKQIPLQTDLESLMQQWLYFYERTIGCVGILKDWLVRSVAAALQEGSAVLSIRHLQIQALSVAQCERLAIEIVEGERLLGNGERGREYLWQLLQQNIVPVRPSIHPVNATIGLREMTISDTPLDGSLKEAPHPQKRRRSPHELSSSPGPTASNGEGIGLVPTREPVRRRRKRAPKEELSEDNLCGENSSGGVPHRDTPQSQL